MKNLIRAFVVVLALTGASRLHPNRLRLRPDQSHGTKTSAIPIPMCPPERSECLRNRSVTSIFLQVSEIKVVSPRAMR